LEITEVAMKLIRIAIAVDLYTKVRDSAKNPEEKAFASLLTFVYSRSLAWTYTLMSKRLVKIHPSLQEMIVSLRTAVVLNDWKLDNY